MWSGLCDDMGKGADDLIDAIKKDDDKAFKKAINNLNHSCNDCHAKFRDDDVAPADPTADVAKLADLVDKPDEFKNRPPSSSS